MASINNNYKRFQSYQNNNIFQNSLKKDFMEQNYKVESSKGKIGEKKELEHIKDLKNPDKSFLDRTVQLGIKEGKFFRK